MPLPSPLHRPHTGLTVHLFFFTDTATTEIYTLSLHDALPICVDPRGFPIDVVRVHRVHDLVEIAVCVVLVGYRQRSEEHTSELQSHVNLVCRLLLEKKNTARA